MKRLKKVIGCLLTCLALNLVATGCVMQVPINRNGQSEQKETIVGESIVVDEDDDGLSDYIEIVLGLDPTQKDTDANGINDGEEDIDGDQLTNLNEITLGTDPMRSDTDGDGFNDYDEITFYKTNPLLLDSDNDELDDYEEVMIYRTDPMVEDTDGDGASDGKEVKFGTNPNVYQSTFDLDISIKDEEDTVIPSLKIELSGKQVDTLDIKPVKNDTFFPEDMPGYIGQAYQFEVEGEFENAIISFEFDELKLQEDSAPTIYDFDEETQKMKPLETRIEGNVATTEVTKFSTYILVDRITYEKSFSWIDYWESDGNYTGVEIALVIDDSGSMSSNDYSYQRLSVAKELIEKLPENSKVGIVKFADYSTKLTALTENKATAMSYLTTSYFKSSGGTEMYHAIQDSFAIFESTDDSIMKVLVVLSDGVTADLGLHESTISQANEENIKVYTVGLGNSYTTYFTEYLQPLAENTNAAFYLAADADELIEIFGDISNKIDIETDSDGDGLPDYYEDNMVIFSGVKLKLDKNNPDTDGDGLLDGEEVEMQFEYNEDNTKVIATGKVISDPTKVDSDGDGIADGEDPEPLKAED